ncbi:hypothetical protein B0A58_11710 [Flavobacterium branchiophilum NBRC 15030 = ATCC 35035]|uniref:Uncharacterized membrane protein YgdD (TMEM256/DUF423 family) n=1 Tax=Flavobacterium branchiophilum TaxID=55197 RepID=A0A543G7D4_9FLAO|nr:DUF423 domain-containing protein [Flavobacterium branchiophilum]OXA73543.1 hypothetical protein B0A58_11710 [Flavobacterium branchiophilum NBRC 15030 = ATCC 35035]TQM41995.1 uncharacterized membrane protein YgdD (TMEM256/DUF423 family) [Flavobacterium branchiophilum]GEM55699.1 membrane protein [Flavobacterium branchiophilum NBRC 15030 = ATCC 35035]
MNIKTIQIALFFGISAIILGAFAAHGLKKYITPTDIQTLETGVKYQMYHALFLIFIANNQLFTPKGIKNITLFISFGVLLFSGSIYILATAAITHIHFKPFGILTPIGGILLIMGWSLALKQTFNKIK